jgi:hypothetical protein
MLETSAPTSDAPSGPSASATAAPLASCRLRGLRAGFTGAQPGAGNIVGVITLRNPAADACRLDHTVQLLGLDSAGVPVLQRATLQSPPASPPVVLRARTVAPAPGSAPPSGTTIVSGTTIAAITIAGEYRDEASRKDGLCAPQDEVIPASWKVTMNGQSTVVPNLDRHGPDGPGRIEACLGAFHTAPQSSY